METVMAVIIVIIIVILVFILSGIYLYRAVKQHNKRLDKIAETNPEGANRIATLNCTAPVPRCKCGRIIK